MLDYLIVGLGLAGIAFCEQLRENGKTFHVISDDSQTSSSVAGGLYNPVILKRFTLAWRANEQLEMAIPFYKRLENTLGTKLDHKLCIVRRFSSFEEQNRWFEAMDKPFLSNFLSPEIDKNTNTKIDAPYGYGTVLRTGRVDTGTLLSSYGEYLSRQKILTPVQFDYSALKIETEKVRYKALKAKRLIFAEGFGLRKNPYFNYLPLYGNKGEYVIIKAPDLKEDRAIKSNVFCIPIGNDCYKIGANYRRDDVSNQPTEETRKELIQKMRTFIKCDFTIQGQVAGVRPTVVDRRPLLGRHPVHSSVFVLNGFGSRGVLIAPQAASELYKHIEQTKPLNSEMDILRFTKKYFKN